MVRNRAVRKGEDWQPAFLEVLRDSANVTAAASVAGVGRRTVYERRKKDEEFRAAWEDAIEAAVDALEEEARRRAYKGVLEPVYQGGKKVGTIRKYSDTLLIFLLKAHRPAKFRDRMQLSGDPDEPLHTVITRGRRDTKP